MRREGSSHHDLLGPGSSISLQLAFAVWSWTMQNELPERRCFPLYKEAPPSLNSSHLIDGDLRVDIVEIEHAWESNSHAQESCSETEVSKLARRKSPTCNQPCAGSLGTV